MGRQFTLTIACAYIALSYCSVSARFSKGDEWINPNGGFLGDGANWEFGWFPPFLGEARFSLADTYEVDFDTFLLPGFFLEKFSFLDGDVTIDSVAPTSFFSLEGASIVVEGSEPGQSPTLNISGFFFNTDVSVGTTGNGLLSTVVVADGAFLEANVAVGQSGVLRIAGGELQAGVIDSQSNPVQISQGILTANTIKGDLYADGKGNAASLLIDFIELDGNFLVSGYSSFDTFDVGLFTSGLIKGSVDFVGNTAPSLDIGTLGLIEDVLRIESSSLTSVTLPSRILSSVTVRDTGLTSMDFGKQTFVSRHEGVLRDVARPDEDHPDVVLSDNSQLTVVTFDGALSQLLDSSGALFSSARLERFEVTGSPNLQTVDLSDVVLGGDLTLTQAEVPSLDTLELPRLLWGNLLVDVPGLTGFALTTRESDPGGTVRGDPTLGGDVTLRNTGLTTLDFGQSRFAGSGSDEIATELLLIAARRPDTDEPGVVLSDNSQLTAVTFDGVQFGYYERDFDGNTVGWLSLGGVPLERFEVTGSPNLQTVDLSDVVLGGDLTLTQAEVPSLDTLELPRLLWGNLLVDVPGLTGFALTTRESDPGGTVRGDPTLGGDVTLRNTGLTTLDFGQSRFAGSGSDEIATELLLIAARRPDTDEPGVVLSDNSQLTAVTFDGVQFGYYERDFDGNTVGWLSLGGVPLERFEVTGSPNLQTVDLSDVVLGGDLTLTQAEVPSLDTLELPRLLWGNLLVDVPGLTGFALTTRESDPGGTVRGDPTLGGDVTLRNTGLTTLDFGQSRFAGSGSDEIATELLLIAARRPDTDEPGVVLSDNSQLTAVTFDGVQFGYYERDFDGNTVGWLSLGGVPLERFEVTGSPNLQTVDLSDVVLGGDLTLTQAEVPSLDTLELPRLLWGNLLVDVPGLTGFALTTRESDPGGTVRGDPTLGGDVTLRNTGLTTLDFGQSRFAGSGSDEIATELLLIAARRPDTDEPGVVLSDNSQLTAVTFDGVQFGYYERDFDGNTVGWLSLGGVPLERFEVTGSPNLQTVDLSDVVLGGDLTLTQAEVPSLDTLELPRLLWGNLLVDVPGLTGFALTTRESDPGGTVRGDPTLGGDVTLRNTGLTTLDFGQSRFAGSGSDEIATELLLIAARRPDTDEPGVVLSDNSQLTAVTFDGVQFGYYERDFDGNTVGWLSLGGVPLERFEVTGSPNLQTVDLSDVVLGGDLTLTQAEVPSLDTLELPVRAWADVEVSVPDLLVDVAGPLRVGGDFDFAAATLHMTEGDQLLIDGVATLSGFIDIGFVEGFLLEGDSYTLLTASGIVDNGIALSTASAEDYRLLIDGSSVAVELRTLVPGDFDDDGDVDVADALEAQRLGASLDDWQTNFGTGVSSPAASTSAPEPTSCSLLLLCCLGTLICRPAHAGSRAILPR